VGLLKKETTMRTLDPDTVQEYIDDARREAERCADVAIADLKAEIEDLRAQVKELEPLRPLLQVLHGALSAKDHMTIRHTPMEKVIEIGHMTVHVYGGRSVQLVQALYDAGQSVMVPK
jgi:hypothetical protein